MRQYIAILDRAHLENALFLKSFAQSLAKHGNRRGIILHGDSEYTDRIMQNGVMREEAQPRATKDLNRRLVGLLADYGVSAIGLHAYQREMITKVDGQLKLNLDELLRLPDLPCIVLSNLISAEDKLLTENLSSLASLFKSTIKNSEIVLFSLNERDEVLGISAAKDYEWNSISEDFQRESIPQEFHNYGNPVFFTSANVFVEWPNVEKMIKIS